MNAAQMLEAWEEKKHLSPIVGQSGTPGGLLAVFTAQADNPLLLQLDLLQ